MAASTSSLHACAAQPAPWKNYATFGRNGTSPARASAVSLAAAHRLHSRTHARRQIVDRGRVCETARKTGQDGDRKGRDRVCASRASSHVPLCLSSDLMVASTGSCATRSTRFVSRPTSKPGSIRKSHNRSGPTWKARSAPSYPSNNTIKRCIKRRSRRSSRLNRRENNTPAKRAKSTSRTVCASIPTRRSRRSCRARISKRFISSWSARSRRCRSTRTTMRSSRGCCRRRCRNGSRIGKRFAIRVRISRRSGWSL